MHAQELFGARAALPREVFRVNAQLVSSNFIQLRRFMRTAPAPAANCEPKEKRDAAGEKRGEARLELGARLWKNKKGKKKGS